MSEMEKNSNMGSVGKKFFLWEIKMYTELNLYDTDGKIKVWINVSSREAIIYKKFF